MRLQQCYQARYLQGVVEWLLREVLGASQYWDIFEGQIFSASTNMDMTF
jgi:hypothetical protein